MSVGMFVKKMKLSHMKWLRNPSGHVSLTDSLKQGELFHYWTLWIMDEIVIPTLKVHVACSCGTHVRCKIT